MSFVLGANSRDAVSPGGRTGGRSALRLRGLTWLASLVAAACSGFLVAAPASFATTFVVDRLGGGDFTTLTAACMSAMSGDTLLVALSGVSFETSGEAEVDIVADKDLYIGPQTRGGETLVLDKRLFISGASTVAIEGLVFSSTRLSPIVAGNESTVAISDSEFRQCNDIAVYSSGRLEVRDSKFFENVQLMDGGGRGSGIDARGSAVVEDCVFERNAAPEGGAIASSGEIAIRNSLFVGNESLDGAAVWISGKSSVENCTFYGNVSAGGGGAVSVDHRVTVRNCIIAGTIGGPAITCEPAPTVTCCAFWANDVVGGGFCFGPEDDGNFIADPLFCDPANGNFRLTEGSPCADGTGGDQACGLIGALGAGCGVEPVESTSWGAIKARFRPPAP